MKPKPKSKKMIKQAQKVVENILKSYFKNVMDFFENINKSNCEVVVLLSRKAYLMYVVATMCGFTFRENLTLYSDRIAKRPEAMDASRFDGKRVLLVDDTIIYGRKINAVLNDFREKFNCAKLAVYIFACNTDISADTRDKVIPAEDFNFMVPMSTSEIEMFSLRQVKLVHHLGLAYTLELPIFHQDSMTLEGFNALHESLFLPVSGWKKEDYVIPLINEAYTCNCFFAPVKPIIDIPHHILSEHITYKYAEYDEAAANEEKLYSISIVPMVVLENLHIADAAAFLNALKNSKLSCADKLAYWITELENAAFTSNEYAYNIHKSITYLLSFCLGLAFFNDLMPQLPKDKPLRDNVGMEMASAENHLGKSFIDFVHGLAIHDLRIVQSQLFILNQQDKTRDAAYNAFGKQGLPDEIEDPSTIQSGILDRMRQHYKKDKTHHLGINYISELAMRIKSLSRERKKQASVFLFSLLAMLDVKTADAAQIIRHIFIYMLDASLFSFDLFFDEKSGRLLKKLIPGENSSFFPFYNVLNQDVMNMLRYFYLGVGDYERMKTCLSTFIDGMRPLLKEKSNLLPTVEDLTERLDLYAPDEFSFNNFLLGEFCNDEENDSDWRNKLCEEAYALGSVIYAQNN